MKTIAELIRACFHAYETKDRDALEPLIADDFTFTSPLDDHIDRATYFQRCWQNCEHIERFDLEKLFVQGNEAFVQYQLHSKGQPPFRNTEVFTCRAGQLTSVHVYFGAEVGAAKGAEEQIRAVVEDWAEAIRSRDIPGVLRHFADGCVRFYLAPPLQAEQPLPENLENWFASFSGEIGYEVRGLKIATAGDLAYAHSLNHLTGTRADRGEPVDVWFRETLCFRHPKDRWLITHEHESVPFYMDGSLRAAIDLKPA